VLAVVADKDIAPILKMLPSQAQYYFSQASIPRALDANILKNNALGANLRGESYPSIKKAVAAALGSAKANDLVFIGGSTFTVAEIL
jgi:dihydrofolate synthase / folylpolyglutamate synthase